MIAVLLAGKHIRLVRLLMAVLALAVLATSIHCLHAYQVKRNSRALYDQAIQCKKDGLLPQATDFLEQYLELAPKDTVALAELGFWRAEQAKTRGARQRAMLTLDQVLRGDSNRDDVRRKVAKLALELGRFNDAREHLDLLIRATPEDPELLHWCALAAAGSKDYDGAGRWFAKVIKVAPARQKASLDYATMLRDGLKSPEMANDEIERFIKANPKSVDGRLEAARFYYRVGDLDKAEKHLSFAVHELDGSTADVLLLAAQVALVQNQSEEAQVLLERGCKLYPRDDRLGRELARVELISGHRKEGLALLEPSLANLPEDPQELWSLANLLIDAGAADKAGPAIDRLASKEQFGPLAECLQARLLMVKQKWGEARKTLEGAVPKFMPGAPVAKQLDLLLADCYQHLESPDQWLKACRRAVGRAPNWPPARLALVEALAAQGKTDEAIVEFRLLPKDAVVYRLQLARLLLARNLRLPQGEAHWQEIDTLLQNLPAEEQNKLAAKAIKAAMLIAQKQFEEAIALMVTERDRDPSKVGPWLFLIQVADLQERPADVLALTDDAEKAAGRHIEWEMGRVGRWLKAGDPKAVDNIKRLEARLGEYSLADSDRLRATLADAYLASGHSDEAYSLLQELARHQPNNLRVQALLLERYLQLGQEPRLLVVLDEIRRVEAGGGPFTAYGEAAHGVLQARAGKKDALGDARSWMAKAADMRPSWAQLHVLEAEAFEIESLKEKALEKYKVALDQGEARVYVLRRVFQLMNELHLYGEASALMRTLPSRAVADAGLEMFAAQLALVSPTPAGADPLKARQHALEMASKGVKTDSKNYREFLWLGQIAFLAQKTDEAETAFRHAVALNDAAPDAWACLILFLSGTDVNKAETELGNARGKLSSALAPLALAPGYEALGKVELAETQYEAALAANPADPACWRNLAMFLSRTGQAAKAESCLRKTLEPKTNAPKETIAWARRNLALNLALRGDFQHFQEAQRLLVENASEQTENRDDQLTKALVLATRPDKRRDAIQMLERLSGQQMTTPADHKFVLAQLYEADGNWPKARSQHLSLLSGNDRNPTYLALFIRALLRHQSATEAGPWLDKLVEVAPAALPTLDLRVQVLRAKGNGAEAINLVKSYAKEKDARQDVAATWLEQLGQAADAEIAYRSFAAQSKQPESVLQLALHLTRQKRIPEALDICEKALDNCRPGPVGVTGLTILRNAKLSAAQEKRVEGWLVDQQQKQPTERVALGLVLSELQEFKGRFDEAMATYRDILALNADNVVALNNLAYLLVLKQNDAAAALPLVQKAIDKAGPIPELLATRALIYVKTDRAKLAIADLEQVLQQAPKPNRYVLLAQAQELAANRPAALNAWQRAVDSGLDAAAVHPLEQADFQRLKVALGK
jgi:cellulose synthase operon protein C